METCRDAARAACRMGPLAEIRHSWLPVELGKNDQSRRRFDSSALMVYDEIKGREIRFSEAVTHYS